MPDKVSWTILLTLFAYSEIIFYLFDYQLHRLVSDAYWKCICNLIDRSIAESLRRTFWVNTLVLKKRTYTLYNTIISMIKFCNAAVRFFLYQCVWILFNNQLVIFSLCVFVFAFLHINNFWKISFMRFYTYTDCLKISQLLRYIYLQNSIATHTKQIKPIYTFPSVSVRMENYSKAKVLNI